MATLFISYARENSEFADELVTLLSKQGHDVRMDRASLVAGDNWQKWLTDTITRVDAVVLIWSKHSAKSEWVNREISFSASHEKRILPVRIDDTPIKQNILISELQAIDGRKGADHIAHEIHRTLSSLEPDEVRMTTAPRGERRLTEPRAIIIAALIGLGGLLLAALIAGCFTLVAVFIERLPPEPTLTPRNIVEVSEVTGTQVIVVPPGTPAPSPTFTLTPTLTPLVPTQDPFLSQPFSLVRLNEWRVQNGYAELVEDSLLVRLAQNHLSVLSQRSFPDLTAQPQLGLLDFNDQTIERRAQLIGYNGDVALVPIVSPVSITLARVVQSELMSQAYDQIGIAEMLTPMGTYYLVIVLGTE
jgi:hypothetical protein